MEPFVVWTDHKNLAYLHGVKRLNSRQALWALFLGCLNFTLTYHPGSKNIKPDALSCQCATNWTKQEPGPILASTCVVGLATWQIEERIREAQHSVLMHHVFCLHGFPRDIVSDRGPQFTPRVSILHHPRQ